LQDGSYNGQLLCSKWSQLNVEITIVIYIEDKPTVYEANLSTFSADGHAGV
jgi:hypothetical protein